MLAPFLSAPVWPAAAPVVVGTTPLVVLIHFVPPTRSGVSPRGRAAKASDVRVEAANGVGLGVVGLEDGEQLRNGQQIGDSLRQAQQLEAATLTADRGVGAHDLAQAGAVDIRHFGEIEDELLAALKHHAVDLVLQDLVTLPHGHLALEVENSDVPRRPFHDLHKSSDWPAVAVARRKISRAKAGILA